MAAERAKDRPTTRDVLIPTSCAASLLAAVASIDFPLSVRVRNSHRAATIRPPPSNTTAVCGSTEAPPIFHGSALTKDGRSWKFLSKTIAAVPRSKMEAPIVMMRQLTAEQLSAGSTDHHCSVNHR